MNNTKRSSLLRKLRDQLEEEALSQGASLTEAARYATLEITRYGVAQWPGFALRIIVNEALTSGPGPATMGEIKSTKELDVQYL